MKQIQFINDANFYSLLNFPFAHTQAHETYFDLINIYVINAKFSKYPFCR